MKLQLNLVVLALCMLASPLASVHAAEVDVTGPRLALRSAQQLAQRTAPIHSAEQLDAYLQNLPMQSPIEPLSTWGKERFVRSLRFNENGLTTFDYRPLVEELSASQARRLLALFGAERTLPGLPGIRVATDDDRAAMSRPLPGKPVVD